MMIRVLILAIPLVFTPGISLGQIINGDFNEGLDGWTFSVPSGDASSLGPAINLVGPCTGVAGAILTYPEPQPALACLSQEFTCDGGAEGQCSVWFDYSHEFAGVSSRFVVRIDGLELFASSSQVDPCTTVGPIDVPCGTHTIEFCLDLTSTQELVNARIVVDNVHSSCNDVLPTDQSSWGAIKALFR